MSAPPQTTLLLENVEDLGPDAVLGIDTQFFSVKNVLKGIKLIPNGLHFLHYSEALDNGSAVRYGRWFNCHDQSVSVWDVKSDAALRTPTAAELHELGALYPYMAEYPGDRQNWAQLTRFFDEEVIEEYVGNPEKVISTATPSSEENMVLLDILKQKGSQHTFSQDDHDELRYTIIQSHKRRDGTSGAEVTADILDRSWYLSSLFSHDLAILLAELQLSFLHFLLLGNVCSLTQWTALLKLISSSRSFLAQNAAFSADFLRLFEAQLALFPTEYLAPSSSQQIVDMEVYESLLANFNEVYGPDPAWRHILLLHKTRFGISVAPRSAFDADNFEVYDFAAYDSADEDAPALA